MYNIKDQNNYKYFISLVNIFIFLNIAQFLIYKGIIAIPGYVFVFFFGILTLLNYILKKQQIMLPRLMAFWVLYYLLIVSISLIYISEINLITWKIYYMIYFQIIQFFIFYYIYNLDTETLDITRKNIIFISLFAVFLIILSFIRGDIFLTARDYLEIYDARAAAVYLNANIAANFLNFALIIAIDKIKFNLRIYFILIIGIGILVTFSRSNILIYLIIISILAYQRKINFKQFVSVVALFFLLISVFIISASFISDYFDIIFSDNMLYRLEFFTSFSGEKSLQDSSATTRLLVANYALNYFLDNPIFGAGVGLIRMWNMDVAPHNTYLAHMAEYGLFGLILMPFLLYSLTRNIFYGHDKELKQLAILFIVFVLLSSFFTHNMLDNTIKLAMYAIILSLSINSTKKADFNG